MSFVVIGHAPSAWIVPWGMRAINYLEGKRAMRVPTAGPEAPAGPRSLAFTPGSG